MKGENEQGVQRVIEEHPVGYCENLICWCHFDAGYHELVTEMPVTVSSEDYQQALSFFGVVNAR